MKNGPLEGPYILYADDMNALQRREAQDIIKGNVKDAVKILGTIMTSKGAPEATRVTAAKEFLNRALGSVPSEHKGDALVKNVLNINDIDITNVGTVDLLLLLERMDQLQNVGPNDNQQQTNTEPQ